MPSFAASDKEENGKLSLLGCSTYTNKSHKNVEWLSILYILISLTGLECWNVRSLPSVMFITQLLVMEVKELVIWVMEGWGKGMNKHTHCWEDSKDALQKETQKLHFYIHLICKFRFPLCLVVLYYSIHPTECTNIIYKIYIYISVKTSLFIKQQYELSKLSSSSKTTSCL
jgi:hypothetical protein